LAQRGGDNLVSKIKCSSCGGEKCALFLYGLPDFSAVGDKLERGEVVLGGCDLSVGSPKWFCHNCRHEWGESEVSVYLRQMALDEARKAQEAEESALKRGVLEARKAQEAEESALKRGVLEVRVNKKNGRAICPYCHLNFKVNARKSFKNNIHQPCRTRLSIVWQS
jgi:hypothetical protein